MICDLRFVIYDLEFVYFSASLNIFTIMKKINTLLVLLLMSLSVVAQTEKGRFLPGGNFSFSSSNANGYKEKIVNANVSFGYFVQNNLAMGIALGGSSDKLTGSGFEDKTSSFLINPFFRYYFTQVEKAKMFAEFDLGVGNTTGDNTYTDDFTFWRFAAGPEFFLTKNVGLEFALFFGSLKYNTATSGITQMGTQFGFRIHL